MIVGILFSSLLPARKMNSTLTIYTKMTVFGEKTINLTENGASS